MSPKTFQDLITEVHDKGICQECGGCVSFCSSAEYDIIALKDPYSPPVYINKDQCLECGICYYICPQTHVLDDELNKTYQFKDFSSMPIGNFINIYSCQATDQEFLKYGTDGPPCLPRNRRCRCPIRSPHRARSATIRHPRRDTSALVWFPQAARPESPSTSLRPAYSRRASCRLSRGGRRP